MRFCASGSLLCGSVLLLLLVAPSPAAAQKITVANTDPNMAVQGTINLDVTINGSGYKHGAKAHWFVTGTTNPGGVTVNSTSYVSSSQLTANITVAVDAAISGFDVQVANADGRTGVGIDAFTITEGHCSVTTPAGFTLVDTLNKIVDGAPQYTRFAQALRMRAWTVNGRKVLVVAVGNFMSTLEFFFLDPATGQILDNTVIGSTSGQVQPHLSLPAPANTRFLVAGDVNGDGVPDFLAADYVSSTVRAWVGSVNSGILNYQAIPLTNPEGLENFGYSMAMGDLDSDGSDEIAVSALDAIIPIKQSGKVYLFRFNGVGFTRVQTIPSPLPNRQKDEMFGTGIAIGDVAGAPGNDLIVGAPGTNVNGNPGAGRAIVFTSPLSNPQPAFSLSSGGSGDNFGGRVLMAKVTGASTDLVSFLEMPFSAGTKAQVFSALVYSGESPTFTLLPDPVLNGGWATQGWEAADLNGDGRTEVLVGAPNSTTGGCSTSGGAANVYLTDPLNPANPPTRYTLQVPAGFDTVRFGWGVTAVNGSRIFLVGDNGNSLGGVSAGQVFIYKLN